MGRWLENTVNTEVQASADKVWVVWSDLEAMPKWMRWIESVKTQEDDPDLTDWILAAQGFRFTWKARITQRVEAQQLHWAANVRENEHLVVVASDVSTRRRKQDEDQIRWQSLPPKSPWA